MRSKKRTGRGSDTKRRFIEPRLMRVIRWDQAVANRQIKAGGRSDEEYCSLHAWGCGCCFLVPVKKLRRSWFVTPVQVYAYDMLPGPGVGSPLTLEKVKRFRGPYETKRIAQDVATTWHREGVPELWVLLIENGRVISCDPSGGDPADKMWRGVLGNARDPRGVRP